MNEKKEIMIKVIDDMADSSKCKCDAVINFLKHDIKGFEDEETGILKTSDAGFCNIQDMENTTNREAFVDFERSVELNGFIVRFGKSIKQEIINKITEEIISRYNAIENKGENNG